MVERNGFLIPFYEDRFELNDGDEVKTLSCRYRTLGCWPLTAAVESTAKNVEEIVAETMIARVSERTTRVIDFDQEASMETKKREGYF
jgi:sulfate adenylyltransferase subunit 2